jgi:hypothetical protein
VESADKMRIERKFQSKTMGQLAEVAGVGRETFKTWLTADDKKKMIDLGWDCFSNMLPPNVVRYLYARFIDNEI